MNNLSQKVQKISPAEQGNSTESNIKANRKARIEATTTLTEARTKASELLAEKRNLEVSLPKLKDAKLQADRRVDIVARQSAKVTSKKTELNKRKDELDAEIDGKDGVPGLKEELTRLKKEYQTKEDELLKQKDPKEREAVLETLRDLRVQIDRRSRELREKTGERERINEELSNLADAEVELTGEKRKAEADQASLATKLSESESKITALTEAHETKVTEIETSQRKLNALVIEGFYAAQNDAENFAQQRDNRPFYICEASVVTDKSTQQVLVVGYPDSNTIVLRGEKSAVNKVKEFVQQFDQPSPQARISLYTLQVNGSDSARLRGAMENIGTELRSMRSTTALVQELLRQSLTNEVNRVSGVMAGVINEDQKKIVTNRMLRSYFYPQEVRHRLGLIDFRTKAGENDLELRIRIESVRSDIKGAISTINKILETKAEQSGKRESKVRDSLIGRVRDRVSYIINEVQNLKLLSEKFSSLDVSQSSASRGNLIGLEIKNATVEDLSNLQQALNDLDSKISNPKFTSRATEADKNTAAEADKKIAAEADKKEDLKALAASEYLTRYTLPDPVHSTTLGEVLFVVSLGNKSSRIRILRDFARLLQAEYPSRADKSSQAAGLRLFIDSITRKILPEENDDVPNTLYPQFPNMLVDSDFAVLPRPDGFEEISSNQHEVLLAMETKAKATVARLLPKENEQKLWNTNNVGIYDALFGWLARKTLVKSVDEVTRGNTLKDTTNYAKFGEENQCMWEDIVSQYNTSDALQQATPRVAAADEMIKRMIIVVENDFEHFFTDRGLQKIREYSTQPGLDLGTFQKESLLATNRLIARISPEASANLTVGRGVDVLDEAKQLGQLLGNVSRLGPVPAKASPLSSGITAAGTGVLLDSVKRRSLDTMNLGGVGGILGLLDLLSNQGADRPASIYSINSGSQFNVTPIFDPSGQALRFQFDFDSSTIVQDPIGEAESRVPRVEHHTVNTEVQLTNLEFREISGFETNARVGTETVKSGGLPILRYLPVLKDIPLIGYYYKRDGSAATRQQSPIFAQTSIYPTVADIVNLLVDVSVPNTSFDLGEGDPTNDIKNKDVDPFKDVEPAKKKEEAGKLADGASVEKKEIPSKGGSRGKKPKPVGARRTRPNSLPGGI